MPRQTDRQKHHAALPYQEAPAFVARLRSSDFGEVARLAFEFLILTALRTSEVIEATWSEIDFQQAIWTIPAERMKTNAEHRVPLSSRALEILNIVRPLAGQSAYIFPGQSPEKPMSNMVFLMGLRRMGLKVTTHGFRSTFRDWAAENTNTPREVAERVLAHRIKNKTEAAYNRAELLAKRRSLLQQWAAYIMGAENE